MKLQDMFNHGYFKITEKKQGRTWKMLSILFPLLVGVVIVYTLFTGTVSVNYEEDKIAIGVSWWTGKEVKYKDIASIEYLENFDVGNRDMGMGNFKINVGDFSNTQFGSYDLYAYIDCEEFIVIYRLDGSIVVYNAENTEETQKLYQILEEKINP